MRRVSLGAQVFLSIVGVSLGTVVVVAAFARVALSAAFDSYLAGLPSGGGMAGRPGMGRMLLGTAEQSFIASVDRSALGAAAVVIAIAALVALVLAAYLARPLRRLEVAAEELAAGDLTHRVQADGPAEVAALGDAFNHMADSLERAEELRRRMVADVAHELRNPLAAARAQAEGMADGVLRVDEARLLSLVDDLMHLSALVDDLQELAVAEAGRLRYEMAPTDLSTLARQEAQRVGPLLADGVEIRVEGDDAPHVVTGDERRLGQVLRNLLSNAARHTATGSVAVRLTSDGEREIVSVVDTGEGMSAEDVQHAFERFYRADAARAARRGGAGLGLAISRAIVLDHGGEISAESEPNGGTAIALTLPAAAPERDA
ncbi:MAG: HAMP domain-containing sensor histidine kinase [Actinomycetota bacterium]|nr:HAMP domain-containing sensor histidine kinase [Actinomycetota bacterium]